jgi:hypothetical protein
MSAIGAPGIKNDVREMSYTKRAIHVPTIEGTLHHHDSSFGRFSRRIVMGLHNEVLGDVTAIGE